MQARGRRRADYATARAGAEPEVEPTARAAFKSGVCAVTIPFLL